MIESIWAKNSDGDRLDLNLALSGEQEALVVFSMTGLGPPAATINGTGGPNFDGLRVNSARTDARYIVLTLAVPVSGEREEDARQKVYTYFPIKQTITFGIKTDREELVTQAYIESNEGALFSKVENFVITLLCPMPYFEDYHAMSVKLNSWPAGDPKFEFPFYNPWLNWPQIEFGWPAIVPDADKPVVRTISYAGRVTTGVTIKVQFFGYVKDLVIRNTNGNQEMTFDFSGVETHFGDQVQDGDEMWINTRTGTKWAYFRRDGTFWNMINGIGIYDDWIELRPGENTLIGTAGLVVDFPTIENCDVNIEYTPLSEGI